MLRKKGALWFYLFFVMFILFYFLACGRVVPKSINWAANFDEASKMAKSQNKNMIVDFYTDWCKWCKRMADSTFTDTSVIRFSMDYVFFKANAEKDTALAERYKVNGYPTVILANSSGEEIDRVVGYATSGEFIKYIKGYLKGEGTLADFENKVKQNPNDIELWFKLGEKYQERRSFDQAVTCFNKVVALDPTDKTEKASEALFNIGLLYMGRNVKQFDKAIEAYQRVVKEFPKSKVALDAEEYIPYSYEKMADTTKALSLYKQFLKDHPTLDPGEKDWVQKRIEGLEGTKEKQVK